MPRHTPRMARHLSRGFSLVEMLVALVISATLLTATLAALDASFKTYKVTTDSASTHVVGRLVMHRLSTLIRTGEQFGPYPTNPILTPIIESEAIEFVTVPDSDSNIRQVWRIERVAVSGNTGPYELRAHVEHYEGNTKTHTSTRTLLRRVHDIRFTLEYDVGPRLRRATIDMTLQPDDIHVDSLAGGLEAPAVRLVTSVSPRGIDD